jgi:hypothetical protein
LDAAQGNGNADKGAISKGVIENALGVTSAKIDSILLFD